MAFREKILVGVMVVALFYGGYTLLDFDKSPQTGPAAPEDTQAKTIALSALRIASQARLNGLELYVLETALDAKGRNPFHRLEAIAQEPSHSPQPIDIIPDFVYHGFVDMQGASLLVVINGREYQAGDQLEYLGYYLAKADKDAVLIQRRSPSGVVTWSGVVKLDTSGW